MYRHRDYTTSNQPLRASLRLIRGGKEESPEESPLGDLQQDTFLRAHYLEKPKDKKAQDQLTLFRKDSDSRESSSWDYDEYDN